MSVIIPTCSAERYLPDCLSALEHQTLRQFEVIVVDNGSADQAVEALMAEFPWVRLVRMVGRQGFSKPVNLGCREALSDLLFVLNDDTAPDPDCLSELLNAARTRPDVSFFAALMVYYDSPGTVNTAAHALLPCGVVVDWGVGQPVAGEIATPQPVFGACAGAALYRREMFEQLGGFDEDLNFLYEDADLDFRAQLRGHTCWTVPTARVPHRVSQSLGTDSPAAIRAVFRNGALSILKNLPPAFWRRHRRQVLMHQWMSMAYQTRRGLLAPLLSAAWGIHRLAPRMLAKRRAQMANLLLRGDAIEQWAQWSDQHATGAAAATDGADAKTGGQLGRLRRMLLPALLALVPLATPLLWFAVAALQDRWFSARLSSAAGSTDD